MENEVIVESFEEAVDTLKKATNNVDSRIRNNYLTMIKYYLQVGEGRISKYGGVIITQKLINIFIKRYLQLGGKYQEIFDK